MPVAACVFIWVIFLFCVIFVCFCLKQQSNTDLLLSGFASAPRALNLRRKLVRNVSLCC